MLRSLRTAETAMNLRQAQINTLANNLANVDATGFKQVLTRVAEKGTPAPVPARGGGETAPADAAEALAPPASALLAAGTLPGAAAGTGTAARRGGAADATELEMYGAMDARPGPLRDTGRATDLALQGRGFFVVQTPQGEMYTRNGHFTLSAQGQLVTAAGHPVLGAGGPIEVDGPFAVGRDGTLTVGENVIGRLQVVDFADPSRMQHRGDALLAPPRDATAAPVAAEEVDIVQGSLEGSNVDPVMTLVAMIAAQRAFEIESRVMQAGDENLDKAVNQLPAVR